MIALVSPQTETYILSAGNLIPTACLHIQRRFNTIFTSLGGGVVCDLRATNLPAEARAIPYFVGSTSQYRSEPAS